VNALLSSIVDWFGTFTAELSTFERKLHVPLSHEANKAMNPNASLSDPAAITAGDAKWHRTFAESKTRSSPTCLCPDSEYLSQYARCGLIVLEDYCLRLAAPPRAA
jgi:hypothetical protein